MKFLKGKLLYMGLAAFMTFVASCGGGGGGGGTGAAGLPSELDPTPESTEKGIVTVLATDLDTDQFSEINLTVTRAELLGDAGNEPLFEGEKTFNLLALANVTEVFSVAEVPAGTYNKIRLTLTQIELVFADGRPPAYPKLPGNGKLDINPQGDLYVDADNPLTLELDFDAEKSLHVVGNGNGGFNFRPVVLTKQVENEFDTKLIRQMGVVRNLNVEAGTFDLCLIEDEADCVSVALDGTALFGATGEPIEVGDLSDGAIATVVGRFYERDDMVAAAAGSGSSLKRLGSSSSVSALDDEPLCEEVEGQLICGERVCEELEGQLICDEDFVCDDIEGELVCEEIVDEEPNEGCFEFEGELICDEACEVIEEELVCDDDDDSSDDDVSEDDDSSDDDVSEDDDSSDDDVSEDDDSSDDDVSEDDDSSDDDVSEDDDSSDDDASEDDVSEDDEASDSDARVVLVADIIWLGDDFSRSENVACGPVTKDDVQGTWYQNAELDGEDIVVCDDENSRPTTLLPGARIYDREGNPLTPDAIQDGVINVVDGFETENGLLAVLVIVEPADDDERVQLSGTIGVIEEESLSLITDLGDRCVVFGDDTDVFVTGLDEADNIVFSESDATSLAGGQRADAFGEENSEGCLEADTLIIELE